MIDLDASLSGEMFAHVRVILGMIVALAFARLLNGFSQLIQSSATRSYMLIQTGWTIYLFFSLLSFWWFQVQLSQLDLWRFNHYIFLIFYVSLYFFICVFLYPDKVDPGSQRDEVLIRRRKIFFLLLVLLSSTDIIDTLFKGIHYFQYLGSYYLIHESMFIILALIAVFVRNRYFHLSFVLFAIIEEIIWTARQYSVMS